MTPGILLDFRSALKYIGEGTYRARVASAALAQSKAGNPMVEVKFQILDEPEYVNKPISDNWSLLPQALWRTADKLKAFGYSEEELMAGEMEFDPESLIGLECRIQVELEQYEGRDRSRVTEVLPLEG